MVQSRGSEVAGVIIHGQEGHHTPLHLLPTIPLLPHYPYYLTTPTTSLPLLPLLPHYPYYIYYPYAYYLTTGSLICCVLVYTYTTLVFCFDPVLSCMCLCIPGPVPLLYYLTTCSSGNKGRDKSCHIYVCTVLLSVCMTFCSHCHEVESRP